jgi:Zn-dependent protease with chaperone function
MKLFFKLSLLATIACVAPMNMNAMFLGTLPLDEMDEITEETAKPICTDPKRAVLDELLALDDKFFAIFDYTPICSTELADAIKSSPEQINKARQADPKFDYYLSKTTKINALFERLAKKTGIKQEKIFLFIMPSGNNFPVAARIENKPQQYVIILPPSSIKKIDSDATLEFLLHHEFAHIAHDDLRGPKRKSEFSIPKKARIFHAQEKSADLTAADTTEKTQAAILFFKKDTLTLARENLEKKIHRASVGIALPEAFRRQTIKVKRLLKKHQQIADQPSTPNSSEKLQQIDKDLEINLTQLIDNFSQKAKDLDFSQTLPDTMQKKTFLYLLSAPKDIQEKLSKYMCHPSDGERIKYLEERLAQLEEKATQEVLKKCPA